jgi:hypothetical protein
VIGEEALIGPCSRNLTIAVPAPFPTIAPGRAARASAVSVAASLSIVQRGRPVVSTESWRSKRIVSSLRVGGSAPVLVEIEPHRAG